MGKINLNRVYAKTLLLGLSFWSIDSLKHGCSHSDVTHSLLKSCSAPRAEHFHRWHLDVLKLKTMKGGSDWRRQSLANEDSIDNPVFLTLKGVKAGRIPIRTLVDRSPPPTVHILMYPWARYWTLNTLMRSL